MSDSVSAYEGYAARAGRQWLRLAQYGTIHRYDPRFEEARIRLKLPKGIPRSVYTHPCGGMVCTLVHFACGRPRLGVTSHDALMRPPGVGMSSGGRSEALPRCALAPARCNLRPRGSAPDSGKTQGHESERIAGWLPARCFVIARAAPFQRRARKHSLC